MLTFRGSSTGDADTTFPLSRHSASAGPSVENALQKLELIRVPCFSSGPNRCTNKNEVLDQKLSCIPNRGNPCENWNAPGVEKRKLTVSTKVMMALMLPMKESLAECRSAISNATAISITPIKFDTA
jgi:hypothetical protein